MLNNHITVGSLKSYLNEFRDEDIIIVTIPGPGTLKWMLDVKPVSKVGEDQK